MQASAEGWDKAAKVMRVAGDKIEDPTMKKVSFNLNLTFVFAGLKFAEKP